MSLLRHEEISSVKQIGRKFREYVSIKWKFKLYVPYMSYISWYLKRSVSHGSDKNIKSTVHVSGRGFYTRAQVLIGPSQRLREVRPGDCHSLWGAPPPRVREPLSAGNSCSSPATVWLQDQWNGRATEAPPETPIWEACAMPSTAAKERRKMALASLPATFQGSPEFICNYDGLWKCIQNSAGSGVRETEFSGSPAFAVQGRDRRVFKDGCHQTNPTKGARSFPTIFKRSFQKFKRLLTWNAQSRKCRTKDLLENLVKKPIWGYKPCLA